jgi:hypothetical protein
LVDKRISQFIFIFLASQFLSSSWRLSISYPLELISWSSQNLFRSTIAVSKLKMQPLGLAVKQDNMGQAAVDGAKHQVSSLDANNVVRSTTSASQTPAPSGGDNQSAANKDEGWAKFHFVQDSTNFEYQEIFKSPEDLMPVPAYNKIRFAYYNLPPLNLDQAAVALPTYYQSIFYKVENFLSKLVNSSEPISSSVKSPLGAGDFESLELKEFLRKIDFKAKEINKDYHVNEKSIGTTRNTNVLAPSQQSNALSGENSSINNLKGYPSFSYSKALAHKHFDELKNKFMQNQDFYGTTISGNLAAKQLP